MGFCVAIDGPAGAGKSTIAKKLAKELGFIYVDTGAMYRAIALYLIRNDIKPDDVSKVEEALKDINVTIEYADDVQQVILNGENVSGYIRTEEVGFVTSTASKLPAVREKLLSLQRKMATTDNVIMDGRDIGTCVMPDAPVKIYLTASVETRAKRRWLEFQEKGMECSLKEIEEDIAVRDYQDMNREIAPLKQADDAVLVDSSNMTIDEVVDTMKGLVENKWK